MSYGVTTDHFGLGDTHWRPQTANKAPTAVGKADAADSHGDVHNSTVHGKAKAYTTAYKVVGGDSGVNFSVNTKVKLGTIIAADSLTNVIVTGVEVATSNTDYPVITVSGPQFFGDSTSQCLYTIPSGVLKAEKRAHAMGVVVAGVNRLNSCTLTASLQVVQAADSLGALVQTDGYQGLAEATAEVVNATATPALTADSGWAVSKDQDINTSNVDYGKGVLAVFRNILPDS